MSTGEAMPVPEMQPMQQATAPASMPTPIQEAPQPMPIPQPQVSASTQPAEQQVPVPQQPIAAPQVAEPQMERMEMAMQPIDLSGQSEMPIQQSEVADGGNKKKIIIIIAAVIVVIAAGVGGFFVWKMANAPVEEVPIEAQPIEVPALPEVQEQAVIPMAPEQDAISVIEEELNAFNVSAID